MKKFKIVVSKNKKKYTLVFHSENETKAKERAHKEWYSILSVTEIWEEDITWNKFIFRWIKNNEVKSWMIIWDDIFKVYIKLKESLNYNIEYIYPENEKNITDTEKQNILKEIKEQYTIFKKNKSKLDLKKIKEEINAEKNKKRKKEQFYLQKELDETYSIIVFVLKKIKIILEWNSKNKLNIVEKEKFKLIYNEIVKLKKTTNISKLKEIWELALFKIWKLEVEILNKHKDKETSILLKETNTLLKKIGSKKYFIENRKTFKYILNPIILKIKEFFDFFEKDKKKKKVLDKTSYIYLKTSLLITKYNKRLEENNIKIFKNIIIFILPFWKNKEKRDNLLLRRKVIKQNILLLRTKLLWKIISYTRIKNNIIILFKKIDKRLIIFRKISFNITIFYSLLFILYITYYYYFFDGIYINYKWIMYFIILILVYIATLFSKWFISLIFNFVILFFIVIIWVINF